MKSTKMTHVDCPNCHEPAIPLGGDRCPVCGWRRKGAVADGEPAARGAESEPAPVSEPPAQPKKKTYKRQAPCVNCGQVKTVIGRGIGSCCYYKLSKLPDFDAKFPPKNRQPKKPNLTRPAGLADRDHKQCDAGPAPVEMLGSDPDTAPAERVDRSVALAISARDSELLGKIEQLAYTERRSLDQQILFLLEGALRVAS